MMPTEVQIVQRAIYNWANKIAPNREPADAIKKLCMEEVPELWRTYRKDGVIDPDELADILIITLDLCEIAGHDAIEIVHEKMVINMQRKWTISHGVLQHED